MAKILSEKRGSGAVAQRLKKWGPLWWGKLKKWLMSSTGDCRCEMGDMRGETGKCAKIQETGKG